MVRKGGKLSAISMTAGAETIDRRAGLSGVHDLAGIASAQRSWFKIYNKGVGTVSNESTRVDIYEEIGGWGVTAGEFVEQLRSVATPTIDLHINSPGGSVFDGVAIYNALSQHPATVNGYVDGLAASAASFIAQACDSITMNPGSMMMVHDAIGMTWGNALDHTTMAGLLTQVSDSIADLYAKRAGGTAADWRAVMENNGGEGKWYTAREAVDAGLADKVAGDPEPSGSTGEPDDTQDGMAPIHDDPRDRYDGSSLAAGHRLVQHYRDQALALAPAALIPTRRDMTPAELDFAAAIRWHEDQIAAVGLAPDRADPLDDILATWRKIESDPTGGDQPLVNW